AVAEVEVVPKRRTLQIGERVELFVTLRDANRAVIDEERPVTWESNAPAVVAIGEDGFATGLAPGEAELVATVEGVSDTAEFTVEGIPVERVNIVSSTRRLIPEDEALFVAEVYDLENNLLEGRLITWSSSNEAIANVDEAGLVTAISAGTTMINATSEGKTAAVEVEVYFDFEDVATGGAHACGLIGGVAYCWGANEEGQLGRGTTSTSEPPARVVTQLRFVSLSLGAAHSCGLTRAGAAHCWGSGTDGRLGTGQTARETEPTPVSNGHVFSSLSAGESHTCGIDVTDKLWCWGNGADGRLGNGQAGSQNVPTEISGSLSIRSVSAGGSHTCAITTGSEGHCFGANDRGQLGTGNNTPHSSPTLIPGGYTFVVLKAGSSHTCGLAGSGLVTCFGANDRGQVGDTTNNDRSTPIFVSLPQGVSISGLSAGDDHTCGQAPGGVLYCWGAGTSGQLGDGQGEDAEAPVRVLSDQIFVAFDASGDQSCALNGDGKLYCWGLGASDLPLKVEF
ncbi:MAG: Ig-like domain-containing protein, partial [Bradymonadaceae bacterium]